MTNPSTAAPPVPNLDDVRALARLAALPLPRHREAAVAAILGAWWPDAQALSTRMSAADHQDLVPATVFVHPGVGDGDET